MPNTYWKQEFRIANTFITPGGLSWKATPENVIAFIETLLEAQRVERDKQWSDAFDEIVEEANHTYGGWVPLVAVKESILEVLTPVNEEK